MLEQGYTATAERQRTPNGHSDIGDGQPHLGSSDWGRLAERPAALRKIRSCCTSGP